MSVIPKTTNLSRGKLSAIQVSPELVAAAHLTAEEALGRCETTTQGLTAAEAERRLERYGPNTAVKEQRFRLLRLVVHALVNPLLILLAVLAAVAYLTGDYRAGTVVLVMIVLGVVLKFVQEARADAAAARLRAMISVTSAVLRDGKPTEQPVLSLVPGDVVVLAAGDMIPADVRLLTSNDLFIIQSMLTGESLPVEKTDAVETVSTAAALELRNICFQGTSVESGSATAVVVATGRNTYLGSMATTLVAPEAPTSFDRGVSSFTWLMIRFIAVLVPIVFLINGLTKHDWRGAFLFAMAVAVGLTPEMLPMIVTVCLSRGAIAMSRKKVIVKRLNAIQNLGAMDVLCTDKTGTLTLDKVTLEQHCDVGLQEDNSVLAMAFLNSHFQTGLRNVLDRAILAHTEVHATAAVAEHDKVDEIPFDFVRRLMSVVVRLPSGKHRIICKGAPEAVFPRCTHYELNGDILPMAGFIIEDLKGEYERLSSEGFRVLAVAYRDMSPLAAYSKTDEQQLVLKGYVAFLDPPKESARTAIAALGRHGVSVKILTGDNDLVSRKICQEVGISTDNVLLGSAVDQMTDEELAAKVDAVTLFARLSPAHKQRVILALQQRRRVVGFLGDGINDAPAMRAADVGISVDTAADIARESADVILLEKDLTVIETGVTEGRKVSSNILKYVRMGASSNFGNMFSVLGASAWLPFVPMKPIQILTNNLLYDFSQVPIPGDNVDPEQITRPRPWSMREITRFILLIGPCSSIFDYATYLMMFFVFNCRTPAEAALFQTGWFLESLITQTLVIHVIRTDKLPLFQSRASRSLTLTTLGIIAAGIGLTFSPIAGALGFVRLPALYWPLLTLIVVSYLVLTQLVKRWMLRRHWIQAEPDVSVRPTR
jgi:Mg2+-importing ATPase